MTLTCSEVDTLASQQFFVNQTAAVVHSLPSSDADVLVRLEKGSPLNILSSDATTGTPWLHIQMPSGQEGYIRAITKTITRGELINERAKIRWGYTLGRGKVIMGGAIFLIGAITVVAPLVVSSKQEGSFVLYYGLVATGFGEFLWGVEQMSFVRRSLQEFDSLWYLAFPEKYSKPLF